MTYGFKTILDGQKVAIYDKYGEVRLIEGPRRKFLWGERMEFLRLYVATERQYIRVQFLSGGTEHIPGPTSLFFNPLEHKHVEVKDAISLTAHEVLVVYRPSLPSSSSSSSSSSNSNNDNTILTKNKVGNNHVFGEENVERRVVRGPCTYVPQSDEWFHEFVWHGTDRHNKTEKIPAALKFRKLRTIPDQTYYNVRDVRTSDDALIRIKVMVFFQIVDIEKMLASTHDPIADFINSLTADVIRFTSQLTYEEFLEETAKLSDLNTFPILTKAADRIGYKISNVVYRGYHANDALQRMHDDAIQSRTKLRLAMEKERMSHDLAELSLQKQYERQDREKKMAQEQHEEKLRQEKEEKMFKLEMEKNSNEEQLNFLRELKAQGVDLTEYLCSQYQKPDKLIQLNTTNDDNINNNNNNNNNNRIHFHQKV